MFYQQHIYIYIAIILVLGTNVIVGSIWYTFYWQPLMKIVGSLLFNTHPQQFQAGFTVSTYIQLTWPLTCWAKHGLLENSTNSTLSSMILLANILTPPFCSAISQQVTFDDTGRYITLIVHIILYIYILYHTIIPHLRIMKNIQSNIPLDSINPNIRTLSVAECRDPRASQTLRITS